VNSAVADRIVVEEAHRAVGAHPVLLLGSRAVGTATPASDYDIVVALPLLLLPLRLRRLKVAAERLQLALGAPVSVNPIPASRLQSGRSLFVWKLRREARVLSAPRDFVLNKPGAPPVNDESVFSYLASALLYLLACAPSPGERADPFELRQGVRKALLHLGQLRLMRLGSYCSTLAEALVEPCNADLAAISVRAGTTGAFEAARDALLSELSPVAARLSRGSALRMKARYVVLAALHGRARLGASFVPGRVDVRLARLAAELVRTTCGSSGADCSSRQRSAWSEARRTVLREWPDAHPLAAQ
jgi:predicted nucleotidyltransferase